MQQWLDNLLLSALSRGASDLHLSAGSPAMMRLNDALQPLSEGPLTPENTLAAAHAVCGEDMLKRMEVSGSADFSYSIPGKARFRVSLFKQRGTHSLSFRLCPQALPDEGQLNLPGSVVALAGLKSGLVVLCGMPRSGKSTTAAWLIGRISGERAAHIITVEEPIETLYRHGKGLVNQKEVGLDAPDMQTALTASLREDPDVLYIGNANDGHTLTQALEAALCGKLVICAVDTPDAVSAMQYIVDAADDANKTRVQAQLASTLAAVVAHRLIPAGGRTVALFEVLLNTAAVKGLLRENKLHQLSKVIEASASAGLQTFDLGLARLVAEQKLTLQDAEQAICDRQKFRQYLLEFSK